MKKFLCFRNVLLSCLACCLMIVPMVVQAATLDYIGPVTFIWDPSNDLSSLGIALGDPFTVHIVYDETASPDVLTTDAYGTRANYDGIISEFLITSGDYTATGAMGGVIVRDNDVQGPDWPIVHDDYIIFQAFQTSDPAPAPPVLDDYMEFGFAGDFNTFSGTSLAPALSPGSYSWTAFGGSINFEDRHGYNLQIGSDNMKPVPEPATMLLLGSGILGLVIVGRQRFK